MADAITILRSGNPNTIPNNATWKWIHGLKEDYAMLELHGNLHIKQLEVFCSDAKFDTKYIVYDMDKVYNTRKYVFLTIIDRDPTVKLASGGFNIIIRDIDRYTTIATIRVNYNTLTTKDTLTFKTFRFWTTNNNYGNGFTNLTKNQSMLFGYVNIDHGMMEETDILNVLTLEGKSPYSNFSTMYNDTTLAMKAGPNPTYKDEAGKRVAVYKPVFNPKAKGGNIIQRYACLKGQNNEIVGTSSYFRYYVVPLNTTNTIPTEQKNLPWNSVVTLEFTNHYPEDFNMYISSYPELSQKQEGISMAVENQQWDLVKIFAYIRKRKFRMKILPIQQVTRAALVTAQFHYHSTWDNGKYQSIVHRYDLVASTNETPIDIDGDDIEVGPDGVYEMRLYENETKHYDVYTITPNNEYTYSIENDEICSVNKTKNSITGLLRGTTIVTFKAKADGLLEGTKDLRVIVLPIPDPTIHLNRKLVIVAVDETARVSINTTGIRELTYRYTIENKCEVLEYTDYDKERVLINGNINIKGIEEGTTTIEVQGHWNENPEEGDEPVSKEYIDVIVIPRGTYLIIANPNPCKIRLRKDVDGKEFVATTNARYIGYEMPVDPCFKDNTTFGPIIPTETLSTVFTELYGHLKPIVRGKQYLHLFGHNGDNVKVVTLDVLVRVLDTVDVPKDEIWVSVEHAQEGVEDDVFDNPDVRFFTILKWLERKDVDKDVYSHTIYLPNRNGTLATQEMVDNINKEPKRYYEYANPGDPTRNINPTKKYSLWLNTELNKVWRCLDNEHNFNLWVCEDGRQVGPAEKLIYPGPGMPGYGQGPMSIDLHPLYGIEPLPGCYKSRSKEYGHYKDKFGNIYVYVPKFYTKLEGSE